MNNKLYGGIIGLVVGDALGVPVEFQSRKELKKNPVIDMREYGTHNQVKGTWSDDSSLTLCLIEQLIEGYDTDKIGDKFVKWYRENYWTPYGNVFDEGTATITAINKYETGKYSAIECGGAKEYDNGNGSLMRILPMVYYTMKMEKKERYEKIDQVSSITHAHKRAVIACNIYIEFARQILQGIEKLTAYNNMKREIIEYYENNEDLEKYARILKSDIAMVEEENINSSGYVVDTLEAAIWCFLNTTDYSTCVLTAVNLGDDTDTVAAIAGGLAGIYYGIENIPKNWVNILARKEDICNLLKKFEACPLVVLSKM